MLKIKSIEFNEKHPIFAGKTFDFTLSNRNVAENIIIVGENGKGKTNFLKELLNFIYINYTDKSIDASKQKEIVNKLNNIKSITIELELKRSNIFIPRIDLNQNNWINNNKYNDIYIIANWEDKISNIKHLNPMASEENILDNFFIQNLNLNSDNFFNFNNFLTELQCDNDDFFCKNINNLNMNCEKLKTLIYKMKKNGEIRIPFTINGFFNISSGIVGSRNENKNFVNYSIMQTISLKIKDINNFNYLIFLHDNLDRSPNSNFETNENLSYNNDYIQNTYNWIKQKINDVFDNSNLSNYNDDLQDNIRKSLSPLIKSIKDFFNNDIEIGKAIIDNKNKKNILFLKNKIELFYENLSSGEKLILSICMSILSKVDELNTIYKKNDNYSEQLQRISKIGFNVIKESHSILLFDEIESGLHPKWQSKILNLIKSTSPNVGQRFIATHSPIVCYSINPETDIIINLNDEPVNDKAISFKDYSSIQDCVNKSLNFDYRELSDEHDVWVEGLSDKLYLDIAKKQIEELVPFNILANEHSKSDHGLDEWSGSKFILKKLLLDFLFNKSEDTRKKHLIAIVDGDVLKNHNNELIYSMDFIMNQFREKDCCSKEKQKSSEKRRILKNKLKENINNFDKLNQELNSYENKDWELISLNIIRSKDNKLLQLVILKEYGIEYYLDSKDEVLNDLINGYKKNKCKVAKCLIENFVRTNDNNKLDTTKLEKILKEIKDNVKI